MSKEKRDMISSSPTQEKVHYSKSYLKKIDTLPRKSMSGEASIPSFEDLTSMDRSKRSLAKIKLRKAYSACDKISLTLTPSILIVIDEISNAWNVSRSEAVRILLEPISFPLRKAIRESKPSLTLKLEYILKKENQP